MLRLRTPCLATLTLGLLLAPSALSGAAMPVPVAPPAGSQPSTRLAATPESLSRSLIALNDSDPAIREAARRALLGLRVDDLFSLLEAVRLLSVEARTSSVLALTLRDAIVHIHLRDAKARLLAERRAEIGLGDAFLGVSLGGDPWNRNDNGRSGVPIRATMPGYVAYEVFEEGDVLIGVRTSDGLERLVGFADLRVAFERLAPGDLVEFLVVRGGRVLQIPVVVDERLASLPGIDGQWTRLETKARIDAEAFWQERLAPLLSRSEGPTANAN